MSIQPNPTAIDLVTLVRRFKALGGSSTLPLMQAADEAPEVIACIAPIMECEPLAWDPPRASSLGGTVPATFDLRIDGIRVQVWGVPRPSTYLDEMSATPPGSRFDAQDRAGLLLLDMAGIGPKRRGGRRAA